MVYKGNLQKMKVFHDENIHYEIHLGNDVIPISDLINKTIGFQWNGVINCVYCSKITKNSFGEGFCYPCFTTNANASPCIIRPELCKAHLGEGRDLEWEEKNHNQEHYVYLAASDVVKVGVTRSTNLINRWIDQGANMGIMLALTPNRFEAGRLEVELKSFFSDKTNYRKMLTNQIDDSIDLVNEKWELFDQLPSDLTQYFCENDEIVRLNYPVRSYPEKIRTVDLKKIPLFESRLIGIKGQYLIFENGDALNIRKHTGFSVNLLIADDLMNL